MEEWGVQSSFVAHGCHASTHPILGVSRGRSCDRIRYPERGWRCSAPTIAKRIIPKGTYFIIFHASDFFKNDSGGKAILLRGTNFCHKFPYVFLLIVFPPKYMPRDGTRPSMFSPRITVGALITSCEKGALAMPGRFYYYYYFYWDDMICIDGSILVLFKSTYLPIIIIIYHYLSLSIIIYLYLSPSISIDLYLSLSISIYLYLYLSLSISISVYLYLSLSISIYLCLSLSISIYLYLSLSISIYLYLSLSISIYLYLSLSISIYLSIYPSIYLSTYLSIYLSIYLPIYLSTYLFFYLSIYLSTYLPTYPSVYIRASKCFHPCPVLVTKTEHMAHLTTILGESLWTI